MLILIKCINIKLYRSLRVLDVDINVRFNRLSVLATHAKKKKKKKEFYQVQSGFFQVQDEDRSSV